MLNHTIEHITTIDASADTVWDILTDVATYGDWNPFLGLDVAPDHVSQRLVVTVRPGRRTMKFAPTVIQYEPGRSIAWRGRFLMPRIFDGIHEMHVEPIDDGRCRFVHRETFRGVLVPFGRGMLRDTDAGFAAMNAALAVRAERSAAKSRT